MFVPLATILRLDDRTKISFFRDGLRGELKRGLMYQLNLPVDFDAYVQTCIMLDNQIRANREARDVPRTQTGQFAQNPAPRTSTSTGTHSGSMDLSAAGRTPQNIRGQRRGPLNAAEKKRRRDNSLCLYCGNPGHWASA